MEIQGLRPIATIYIFYVDILSDTVTLITSSLWHRVWRPFNGFLFLNSYSIKWVSSAIVIEPLNAKGDDNKREHHVQPNKDI